MSTLTIGHIAARWAGNEYAAGADALATLVQRRLSAKVPKGRLARAYAEVVYVHFFDIDLEQDRVIVPNR